MNNDNITNILNRYNEAYANFINSMKEVVNCIDTVEIKTDKAKETKEVFLGKMADFVEMATSAINIDREQQILEEMLVAFMAFIHEAEYNDGKIEELVSLLRTAGIEVGFAEDTEDEEEINE